ncbi:hypothetical protein AB0Y20_01120 [Heyndrickxia oleronia]|uniref:hypothetical protein n=1 Tax=Heyndrickxia oleronia TaxID=38875 RepID=UPI003F236545
MKTQDILNELSQYRDKAFRLTEFTNNSIEIYFKDWHFIYFHYDEQMRVSKVEIVTHGDSYYGETEEHFRYCLEFIKINSELIIFSKNKYGTNHIA